MMTAQLDEKVISGVFSIVDEHIDELEAVQKRGIESNSPLAHRHFEEAMKKSIGEAKQIRHEFLMEVTRIKLFLKGQ